MTKRQGLKAGHYSYSESTFDWFQTPVRHALSSHAKCSPENIDKRVEQHRKQFFWVVKVDKPKST